ncbi:hypothetical protein L6Q96_08740 [Candidatus Binatia bacterium]|nr:hypothetical protein [Candidatus Binatia bacterium]
MAANLLHQGATVQCTHRGQAQPMTTNQRVKVGGQPVVTQSSQYSVSGCPNPTQSGGPCVSAKFLTAATRVRAGRQSVLLSESQAVSTPTGNLNIISTQTRVKGT